LIWSCGGRSGLRAPDLDWLDPAWSLLAWAASDTGILAFRLGLALCALPGLYFVLGEPGEGWAGGFAAVCRRLVFAGTGSAVCFLITANWVPQTASPEQGRGFQSYVEGVYLYRFGFTNLGHQAAEAGDPRAKALPSLSAAVEALPDSVALRRTLGIAEAERGRFPTALQQLDRAMDRLQERAPARARQERRLWRTLFGPDPPPRAVVDAAGPEVERYRLGWLGRVALLAAYQRNGDRAAPEALREELASEANAYFQRLLTGAVALFLVLPQLGLITLVVGVILYRTGVLRPVCATPSQTMAPLWEAFILMLALGTVPVLLLPGGARPSPETQPGLYAFILASRDLVQLLAVFYLAWRLRRIGLGLGEVGLTGRAFWRNVGVGLLAGTVLVPAVFLVGFLIQFVTSAVFPRLSPPYHPLQGLTATSSSNEIRWALGLAAVVGAPLLEETFFRGALYGALRRRWGIGAALLGSSAFFALLHPQLPLGFIPIALLGAGFAALYEWRQSLVPAMVAHALNNGLIFWMLNLLFPSPAR